MNRAVVKGKYQVTVEAIRDLLLTWYIWVGVLLALGFANVDEVTQVIGAFRGCP